MELKQVENAACRIGVILTNDKQVGEYDVQESRDEIKGRMEQPAYAGADAPPGLVEQPAPANDAPVAPTPVADAPRARGRQRAQPKP